MDKKQIIINWFTVSVKAKNVLQYYNFMSKKNFFNSQKLVLNLYNRQGNANASGKMFFKILDVEEKYFSGIEEES